MGRTIQNRSCHKNKNPGDSYLAYQEPGKNKFTQNITVPWNLFLRKSVAPTK